tara:strand:- start:199 stop:744 length:546 start_codon:yes stop_codon:yes gene_type:complete
MIKLKKIINEISIDRSDQLLSKIKNKQFKFLDSGDNGKVYEIDGEDLLFKTTTEPDEKAVADVIVGRFGEFNAFIPVHYSHDTKNMYILNKADQLSDGEKKELEMFYQGFKNYMRQEGPNVTVFNYLDTEETRNYSAKLINFLRALQQQVRKTNIGDLDQTIDFKPDNIMKWNGNLVMIDW